LTIAVGVTALVAAAGWAFARRRSAGSIPEDSTALAEDGETPTERG
jgi:hypothetical protein